MVLWAGQTPPLPSGGSAEASVTCHSLATWARMLESSGINQGMPMLSTRVFSALLTVLPTFVCVSAQALAQTATPAQPDCVQSFENAQSQRKEGKLKASAESLIACSQPNCPAFIAKECTNIYTEVQSSLPSVTIRVTDGQGQLLTDVDVFVDGVLHTKKLDGRAVAIDPGVHEFRFESEGKPPITSKVLVAEGEKNKQVVVDFPAPKSVASEPTAPPQSLSTNLPPSAPAEKSGPPIAAYVVGGLGVAAVGAGVVLWMLADSKFDKLEKSCKPNCTSAQTDPVDLKYNLSYVSFAVGGAAIATSAVLFILNANSSKPATTTGLAIGPAGVGNGMLASWSGGF